MLSRLLVFVLEVLHHLQAKCELQDMGTGQRRTHTTKTQFAFIECLEPIPW